MFSMIFALDFLYGSFTTIFDSDNSTAVFDLPGPSLINKSRKGKKEWKSYVQAPNDISLLIVEVQTDVKGSRFDSSIQKHNFLQILHLFGVCGQF